MTIANIHQETDGLIVDCFAGGGGASLAIGDVFGRVDIAINHDAKAIAMHKANHPEALHLCENVFRVDPVAVCAGRRVRLAHFSPDCTHHSRAKGGKPVKKNIRGLAWIVTRWARTVRPDVITLENVKEFEDWGPLSADQRPCKDRKGQTFNYWVERLRRYGYRVEWAPLRASDFGDATIRERLFLVARCDDRPIGWPTPAYGDPKSEGFAESGLKPFRTAAQCIDWSIPCPSIFERDRPLAENTMRRIARGMFKFVIDAEEPFIVNLTHQGSDRVEATSEPFRTITGANRGEKALVTPYVARIGQTGGNGGYVNAVDNPLTTVTTKAEHLLIAPHISRQFGQGTGRRADGPLPTVTADGQGKSALVSAFLAQHNSERNGGIKAGRPLDAPISTLMASGSHQQLVAAHLINLKGSTRRMAPADRPMPTVTGQGLHVGEVRAFLVKYYGTGGQHGSCAAPMPTITAKDRLGLVTVAGIEYQITDIGMRMLTPPELFRAHSFPNSYIIDPIFEGKKLTKTDQVAKVGNSVPRRVYRSLLLANFNTANSAALVAA
ncbi:MAG: DNA (cytosine-5-)-methyltransferase [Rhodospirillaceae bacterium]|nr:DNA (cytosine-5-)-methyltransferase [Rhodospirillaceae bacterium]